ncbi:pirin family protein [uncultured Paludibaculum sp.]|uniref:pirin family protein n=1 Tax=uncultured Paludibaculum sp. TaxID=1765020 RepID=UPI002AABAE32|nr:pirin family protein [uncultured Paludibaculum sp.]
MSDFKKLTGVHGSGSTHWVGDGFPVRNLFPSNGLNGEVSPFLMLDYAGPRRFEPSTKPRGVGEHPHRGFETVTIAYQGSVEHRDSAGNSGVIGPGDVQWMTAASGVVHEEMHEAEFTKKGGIFEMVQLWVNLPAKEKMSKPRYQGIESAQIPVVELGEGSVARIIAGSWADAKGAARTVTPVELFDLRLKAGAKVEIPVPEGHNAAVVLLRGGVTLNGEKTVKGEAQIATFSTRGGLIAVEALEDTTLLILGGEPINEPVASYGPFVMNTREQIMQAIEDFNAGRMGRLS